MEPDSNEIIEIYRKRWEIELLFQKIKQDFPLKYFYGESANAIKIQIWMTLIANLLIIVMKKGLTRFWSFYGLATMIRITLIIMWISTVFSIIPKMIGKLFWT